MRKSIVIVLLFVRTSHAFNAVLGSFDPLKPMRATAQPVIDGILDEALWRECPTVTNFKTFAPDFWPRWLWKDDWLYGIRQRESVLRISVL